MSKKERIRAYYSDIDGRDYDQVMALFADNARYRRADSCYDGKPALDDFFRHQRKIHGTHTLETLIEDGALIVAIGRFEGVGDKGDARAVNFTDVWTFGSDDKVVLRRTYLAFGHEYVLK